MKNEFILPFFPELTEESSKGSDHSRFQRHRNYLFIYLLTFDENPFDSFPPFFLIQREISRKETGGEKGFEFFVGGVARRR